MSNEHDIVFPEEFSALAWERLQGYPELLEDWDELEQSLTGDYTAETKARLATLFQVIAFGDSGYHDEQYGGKLGRNRYLVGVNENVVEPILEEQPNAIVLRLAGRNVRIPLGFAVGVTITFPLSFLGSRLYLENRLPPCDFREEHLLSGEEFGCAEVVFIGAALYAPMFPDLLKGMRHFDGFVDPPLLTDNLWYHTLSWLPTRMRVVYQGGVPTLDPEVGYRLPTIATAFSGRGYGEQLALNVGFVRDRHSVDRKSGDRRFLFDLQDLRSTTLTRQRRLNLLKSWAYFLRWIPDHGEEIDALNEAVHSMEGSDG